ncbi:hypothetical protein E1264_03545 [Actinomadura sp. KC216]|uniref:DUF5403 family protein n=1 Tax=Actinomadura sp. KC216 TaxID=2530370 RepID=UPI00104CC380|nr:DUF5403 family protein [Actinomadura sp. KC216]TDB90912.1 hypothetical protein E1264_03545 [Actinomadura sp. KC216]
MSYELYIDDEYVAGMPVVNQAVRATAEEFKAKWIAAAVAGGHVDSGNFIGSINVRRANDKDYWVSATAGYSVPLEFGHFKVLWGRETSERVEGIHLLREIL